MTWPENVYKSNERCALLKRTFVSPYFRGEASETWSMIPFPMTAFLRSALWLGRRYTLHDTCLEGSLDMHRKPGMTKSVPQMSTCIQGAHRTFVHTYAHHVSSSSSTRLGLPSSVIEISVSEPGDLVSPLKVKTEMDSRPSSIMDLDVRRPRLALSLTVLPFSMFALTRTEWVYLQRSWSATF